MPKKISTTYSITIGSTSKAGRSNLDLGSFLMRTFADASCYSLLAANLVTIYLALAQHWSLITIMTTYWIQSIIIGFFNILRILNQKDPDAESNALKGNPAKLIYTTKYFTATFFFFHYGIFHFVYLMFMLSFGISQLFSMSPSPLTQLPVLLAGAGTVALNSIIFLINHLFSYRYNLQRDQASFPNYGRLMFFPYARIIPMHLTILIGGMFLAAGEVPAGILLLFLSLKTLADLIMHAIEHSG
jgi:hypothetical protein